MTVAAAEATVTSLVELMTGRRIDMLFPTIIARPAAMVLEIEGLPLAVARCGRCRSMPVPASPTLANFRIMASGLTAHLPADELDGGLS